MHIVYRYLLANRPTGTYISCSDHDHIVGNLGNPMGCHTGQPCFVHLHRVYAWLSVYSDWSTWNIHWHSHALCCRLLLISNCSCYINCPSTVSATLTAGWDWSPIKKEERCLTKIIQGPCPKVQCQPPPPPPPPPRILLQIWGSPKSDKNMPKTRKSADQWKNLIPVECTAVYYWHLFIYTFIYLHNKPHLNGVQNWQKTRADSLVM